MIIFDERTQKALGYYVICIAPDEIRNKYINKSIAYQKVKGKANPITYSLSQINNA